MNNQTKCIWCRFFLKILRGVMVFLVFAVISKVSLCLGEWISNQEWQAIAVVVVELLTLIFLVLSMLILLFVKLVKMYQESKYECEQD